MSNLERIVWTGLAFAIAGVSVAIACGPDFPSQLLDNRSATLAQAPINSFRFEAAHLLPPPADALKPAEFVQLYNNGETDSAAFQDKARQAAEAQGLSAPQVKLVEAMRQRGSGDDAYAAGDGLPMAVRAYVSGAVDFSHGSLDKAQPHFQAVLDLPPQDRGARAVWAAYMLGRIYESQNDADKAEQAFAMARDLALKGAADPLGLAVASFGEQALIHLNKANTLIVKDVLPPEADAAAYGRDLAQAIHLYAEQAAHGSDSGIQSLRMIASDLLTKPDPHRLDVATADPLTTRLLAIYLLARLGDEPPGKTDDPRLSTLFTAIEAHHGTPSLDSLDRMAVFAYQAGNYDLAGKIAGQAKGPLAAWVQAKLALQRGDLAKAAEFYAAAVKAFPPQVTPGPLDPHNQQQIQGESGVLALARGEYIDALDKLYPVSQRYWGDTAYVAERILTTDELKRFVDAKVTTAGPPTKNGDSDFDPWLLNTSPAIEMRWLLGRRLVRDGRYAESYAYLPKHADLPGSDDKAPDIAGEVQAYAAALDKSQSNWWRTDKAAGLYQAAHLARVSGMQMMGFEAAPDYTVLNGMLEGGVGQIAVKPGAYIGPDEAKRFTASSGHPDLRYHYRFIAADEAAQAADLLPPRSQAFAAVLCKATQWMMSTTPYWNAKDQALAKTNDPNLAQDNFDLTTNTEATRRIQALYTRYVSQGAHVPWAKDFGRSCPQPDFAAAKRMAWTQPFVDTRHLAGQHKILVGGTLLAILGGGTWLILRRRRKAA